MIPGPSGVRTIRFAHSPPRARTRDFAGRQRAHVEGGLARRLERIRRVRCDSGTLGSRMLPSARNLATPAR